MFWCSGTSKFAFSKWRCSTPKNTTSDAQPLWVSCNLLQKWHNFPFNLLPHLYFDPIGGIKGEHGGICPPIRGSSPPHFPPVRRKNCQNQPFLENLWIFAPSEMHFAPSMPPQKKTKKKKILVSPLFDPHPQKNFVVYTTQLQIFLYYSLHSACKLLAYLLPHQHPWQHLVLTMMRARVMEQFGSQHEGWNWCIYLHILLLFHWCLLVFQVLSVVHILKVDILNIKWLVLSN